jgi:UDP-N-acetylglucosamine diphosphorylase/glucosamine-1-phosphate N-acetyltransferase
MECVILAAGEGKRMRPLTGSRPKVMIPLANRPMLEHLIVSAHEAGLDRFVLVVGYYEKAVREHFGDGSAFGVSIRYATQRHQRGTADALSAAKGYVSGNFLLLNGDMILSSQDIREFIHHDPPSLALYYHEHPEEYGTVKVEGNKVTQIVEKAPSGDGQLINAGAYLLNADIFNHTSTLEQSERGEYELTDALSYYIKSGSLTAYTLSFWKDIGSPWDLLDANTRLLESMESSVLGEIEEGVILKGVVRIGRGSTIRSGTYIEGPCMIGERCSIGPHAYIRGATSIGDDCHIGHCTEIKNSVIFHRTKIPHFNYVGDSVIGSGCNFGAGTKVANLRHDRRTVIVNGRDTGRIKFGAIVGDDVQFGINCSVNVGTIVGNGAKFAPQSVIEGHIADLSISR